MMGEIYDIRSAVEHLHDNQYLEIFDRNVRLDLLRKEAIAEHIARTALVRIIGDELMWKYFANTGALARFWKMESEERRRLWGAPINVFDALVDFDPKYIHDGLLSGL